uniref:Transmembrane protein 18 n=1 Tax=Mesocestoides corti TaxID=53468 RepID=A0A5K3FH79_MESCO
MNRDQKFTALMKMTDWRENRWTILILAAHAALGTLTYHVRRRTNVIALIFTFLVTGILSAQKLNKILAKKYGDYYPRENVFDNDGLFITCFWTIPCVMNACFALGCILYQFYLAAIQSKVGGRQKSSSGMARKIK